MRKAGFKHTEETKRLIGVANSRKVNKVCVLCNKPYVVSPTRQNKSKYCSEVCRLSRFSKVRKGTVTSEGHKKKIGYANAGVYNGMFGRLRSLSPAWKGGLSTINELIRGSADLKNWRKAVYKRDNYTCVLCGKRGGELNADHIKPFSLFPELRFELSNGRTLCKDCHKNTDTYGSKINKYVFQS